MLGNLKCRKLFAVLNREPFRSALKDNPNQSLTLTWGNVGHGPIRIGGRQDFDGALNPGKPLLILNKYSILDWKSETAKIETCWCPSWSTADIAIVHLRPACRSEKPVSYLSKTQGNANERKHNLLHCDARVKENALLNSCDFNITKCKRFFMVGNNLRRHPVYL
jgi:hypothetical protein